MRRHLVVIAHPFLVAVYGVLALAAKNSAEVVRGDLIAPIVISLAVATTAWALGRILTRDRQLGGVIALLIVVWFGWYGYVDRWFASQAWLSPISAPRIAAPLIAIALVALSLFIGRRYSRALPRLTGYLNVSTLILVALSAFNLLVGWNRAARKFRDPEVTLPIAAARLDSSDRRPRPDVYIIVLDKYTGSRSLRANYGFDNGPFEDSLRSRGFIVPGAPRSNYVHTHLALASLLNWRLLGDRPAQLTAASGALGLDYTAIEDNRTWRYLHDLGYRFVFFPSAYPATVRNRYADLQLPRPGEVLGEFGAVWSRNTLLMPIGRWWCATLGCPNEGFPYTPAPASLIQWKFEHLAQMPDSTGPLFLFAHFAVPHEPYVFAADCSIREPYWPRSDSGAEEPRVKAAYVEQIECVNRMVLRLTSELLARSKQPPIIILQADHGHGRLGRELPSLDAAGPERAAERSDIFAAYYLPGHPTGVIYDSITPVNVLPRVFNHYFDAGIPLLPDATYWSSWDEPFKFTRVR